jgi:hypothetical protein
MNQQGQSQDDGPQRSPGDGVHREQVHSADLAGGAKWVAR